MFYHNFYDLDLIKFCNNFDYNVFITILNNSIYYNCFFQNNFLLSNFNIFIYFRLYNILFRIYILLRFLYFLYLSNKNTVIFFFRRGAALSHESICHLKVLRIAVRKRYKFEKTAACILVFLTVLHDAVTADSEAAR